MNVTFQALKHKAELSELRLQLKTLEKQKANLSAELELLKHAGGLFKVCSSVPNLPPFRPDDKGFLL